MPENGFSSAATGRNSAAAAAWQILMNVCWFTESHVGNDKSSEIFCMLNDAFKQFSGVSVDLYPESLRAEIEACLADCRFLLGESAIDVGWRFFATPARFDVVYYSQFKCSRNHVENFPHQSRSLRELYRIAAEVL